VKPGSDDQVYAVAAVMTETMVEVGGGPRCGIAGDAGQEERQVEAALVPRQHPHRTTPY